MAGLLDWLGDLGLGSGASPGTMPPDMATAGQPPAAPPPPIPAPDPTMPAAGPPDPPPNPQMPSGAPLQGANPSGSPMDPGAPPAPPMPPPMPPGAAGPAAGPMPAAAPNTPLPLGPGLGVGAPPMPQPGAPAQPADGLAGWAPDQQGKGGILGRALGLSPDQSNRMGAALGAGFTAAGNSAGKSPFQALSSGAGAALEGASKEEHQNTKDAQGYLAQAIASKKAGDDAGYKTNYTAYLAAKLKSEQTAAASKEAAGNKNDSPTQLFLSAQRNVAADPLVKGSLNAYQAAMKGGTPQDIATAKTAYEQTVQDRQAVHLAGVGLNPNAATEISKQPGMTQANPVDAGTMGITAKNIGSKLQPGQFYTNPADGKIYQFKGDGGAKSPSATTARATEDAE